MFWTATETQIYHNHGIPQGPLCSGIIAEVVLKHFDDRKISGFDVKYLRYVDDIRLFAKKEVHLRHSLVALDKLSKDVGLFPQSGKIHIHKITNIDDEIKSVSNPIDAIFSDENIDQNKVRSRITALSPKFLVSDPTKFKFVLAKANPSAAILDRLWRIYEHSPHFYPQIANHISKFKILSERHALRLIKEIEDQKMYPAIRAAFISAATGKIPSTVLPKANSLLKSMRKSKSNTIDLSDALWKWLCHEQILSDAQLKNSYNAKLPSWLQAKTQYSIKWNDISPGNMEKWINIGLRSKSADVAISSAWLCGIHKASITKPIKPIHPLAKILLKEWGFIRRADSNVCGIKIALNEMTGVEVDINWRKLFGKNYKSAEAQIVTCKGYFKTNPTAWVNSMDVFNEFWLDMLYKKDTSIGAYKLGSIGSTINTSTRLKTKYPNMQKFAKQVHDKRLESNLSHPKTKSTNQPTGEIKFSWVKTGSKLLDKAVQEFKAQGF